MYDACKEKYVVAFIGQQPFSSYPNSKLQPDRGYKVSICAHEYLLRQL